nr:MAG TPA: hypothetical protein [Caudoviricetes sp.]
MSALLPSLRLRTEVKKQSAEVSETNKARM